MIPNIYRHTICRLAAYTLSGSLHLSLQIHCNTTAHSLTNFIRSMNLVMVSINQLEHTCRRGHMH